MVECTNVLGDDMPTWHLAFILMIWLWVDAHASCVNDTDSFCAIPANGSKLCISLNCSWPFDAACVRGISAILSSLSVENVTISLLGGWGDAAYDEYSLVCMQASTRMSDLQLLEACTDASALCVNATLSTTTAIAADTTQTTTCSWVGGALVTSADAHVQCLQIYYAISLQDWEANTTIQGNVRASLCSTLRMSVELGDTLLLNATSVTGRRRLLQGGVLISCMAILSPTTYAFVAATYFSSDNTSSPAQLYQAPLVYALERAGVPSAIMIQQFYQTPIVVEPISYPTTPPQTNASIPPTILPQARTNTLWYLISIIIVSVAVTGLIAFFCVYCCTRCSAGYTRYRPRPSIPAYIRR